MCDYAGVWVREWEEDPIGELADNTTQVYWLQTKCGLFADIRIPQGLPAQPFEGNPTFKGQPTEIVMPFAEVKSFAGTGSVEVASKGGEPRTLFTWHRSFDYQPALTSEGTPDIGVMANFVVDSEGCESVLEDGVDGDYREKWLRTFKPADGDVSVCLELMTETTSGSEPVPRKGILIVLGQHFIYVVNRLAELPHAKHLRDLASNPKFQDWLGEFSAQYGVIDAEGRFSTSISAQPWMSQPDFDHDVLWSSLSGCEVGKEFILEHNALQRSWLIRELQGQVPGR